MSKLILVSCVALKREGTHQAKDLYTSIWFNKARAAVEESGHRWMILSSLYGLIGPDRYVATYEKTLNAMRKAERLEWAEMVMTDLILTVTALGGIDEIVFLAGHRYRQDLIPLIRRELPDLKISVPMEGLQIGYQLQWLNENKL